MKSDDFRCKNCGGMMRFDPKSGNLKCENCGTEEELLKNFTNKRHGINNYENRIVLIKSSKGLALEWINIHSKNGWDPDYYLTPLNANYITM